MINRSSANSGRQTDCFDLRLCSLWIIVCLYHMFFPVVNVQEKYGPYFFVIEIFLFLLHEISLLYRNQSCVVLWNIIVMYINRIKLISNKLKCLQKLARVVPQFYWTEPPFCSESRRVKKIYLFLNLELPGSIVVVQYPAKKLSNLTHLLEMMVFKHIEVRDSHYDFFKEKKEWKIFIKKPW